MSSVGRAIGDILPAAVGVALSPLPVSAAILLLLGTHPARRNLGLVLGWMAGLGVVLAVAVLALDGAATDDAGETSSGIGWGKVALGVVLVALALRNWRRRPRNGQEPDVPRWMATVDSFGPGKAFAAGVALSAVNPKNLVLTLSAGTSIAATELSVGGDVVTIVVFVLLATATIALPLIVFLAAHDTAAATLSTAREWLIANNRVVIAVVLLIMGAKILGDGLGILS
ncbi:MAG TPA: GAP family protein [Acidimicrobiia bacterium]